MMNRNNPEGIHEFLMLVHHEVPSIDLNFHSFLQNGSILKYKSSFPLSNSDKEENTPVYKVKHNHHKVDTQRIIKDAYHKNRVRIQKNKRIM